MMIANIVILICIMQASGRWSADTSQASTSGAGTSQARIPATIRNNLRRVYSFN